MKKLEKKNIDNTLALTSIQEGTPFNYLKEHGNALDFEQLSLSDTVREYKEETYSSLEPVEKKEYNNKNLTPLKLDMLSDEEKQLLIYEFNDTAKEYPSEKTIHQLFEEQVERTPDNISAIGSRPDAVPDVGRIHESPLQLTVQITYRQLNHEANRIASYLADKKGTRPGDRVGIFMTRSLNQLPAILGILKAGAIYVPLDPELPQERIQYMINDAVIGIILSEKAQLRELNRLQWECETFHTYLCMDSYDIHGEEEIEKNELMDTELWENVGEASTDEITGGGWVS
ncbi:MAG: AMP-binding protein, partial [bacterium]|nr:AMP-binding protein [bacterium]